MPARMVAEQRTCDVCRAGFAPNTTWQKRCSPQCNSVASNTRKRADPDSKRCRTCMRTLPIASFGQARRSCAECEGLRAEGLKRCCECNAIKPTDEYYRRPTRHDGLESRCKSCRSEASRRGNATPERKRRNRELKLRQKYGIGVADVEAMLARQEGRCAICRSDSNPSRFHVDHNHATGAVRALLCLQCNALLGHAKEDLDILTAAVAYLERHSNEPHMES